MKNITKVENIENRILVIRGKKVMIDRDLAQLFGVETKYLNLQVRRNKERFPEEFMFKLTKKEKDELVTNCHQFKTLKHSYVLPNVFTEHGVAMLAAVLKSKRAVATSIHIINTFVRLREILSTHKELAAKLKELEIKTKNHDEEIKMIFEAIRQLMKPPHKSIKKIGFKV